MSVTDQTYAGSRGVDIDGRMQDLCPGAVVPGRRGDSCLEASPRLQDAIVALCFAGNLARACLIFSVHSLQMLGTERGFQSLLSRASVAERHSCVSGLFLFPSLARLSLSFLPKCTDDVKHIRGV